MKRSSTLIAGLLIVGTLAACGDATDLPPDARDAQGVTDGPSDGTLLGEESAEGQAVLALVNRELGTDSDVDDFRRLLQTEVHESSVSKIVDFRLGQDLSVGTDDDQSFPNLAALDEVDFVGPDAIRGLLRVAEAEGMVQRTEACDLTGILPTESDAQIVIREMFWTIERTTPLEALHEQSCNRIENAVRLNVEADLPADFENMEPFTGIHSIDGALVIDSTNGLTSLRGLDDLLEVRALRIRQNDGDLERIDGLGGIQKLEDLILSGTVPNSDFRLEGLAALEEVENDAHLKFVQGTDPLPSLRKVGGRLDLTGSFGARSENPLSSLESVEEFWISATTIDFRDMPNLRHIGDLRVSSSVTDFRGLERFEEFGKLQISGSGVESFDGLQNVIAVEQLHIDLRRADESNDYTGLSGLELVGGHLFIYSPGGERNLEFASLTTVEGNLDIDQTQITDLRGTFPSLRHVSGNIEINEEVDQAEVDAFVDQLDHFTGTITRNRVVN